MKFHPNVAVVILALLLFAAEIHGGENDKETKEERMKRREDKRRERELKRAERRKSRISHDILDIDQSSILQQETFVQYENGVETYRQESYVLSDNGIENVMDSIFDSSAETSFDIFPTTLNPGQPMTVPNQHSMYTQLPTLIQQTTKSHTTKRSTTEPQIQTTTSKKHITTSTPKITTTEPMKKATTPKNLQNTNPILPSTNSKTTKIMKISKSPQCTEENTDLTKLVSNTQNLFEYVQLYKLNCIDAGQLQRYILKELTGVNKVDMTCKVEFHYGQLYPFQLDLSYEAPVECKEERIERYRRLETDGYLSKGTIGNLENDEITVEEIEHELRINHEYVLTQFPEKVGSMWEEERIPQYLVDSFNDYSVTLEELQYLVFNDDDMAKSMMPMKIRDLLESRPPPPYLKTLLYSNGNETIFVMKVMTNETLLVEIMSNSMHYFYELFKDPKNTRLNMAMSGLVILALVCVMTSLGSTMTIEGIMEHAKHPKGVIIALFAQFGIMPATAFALTQSFNLDVYPAIAILICGCCPGGNLSNMLAFAINGDMDLSILMTTCSSVIGLGMMPLSIYIYSRFIVPIDGGNIIPFGKIILNIVLTILPVSLGLAIKRYRPHWTPHVMKFGAVMLVLCSTSFMVIAGFLMGEAIFTYFPSTALACCAILPMTGYTLGYLAAWAAREPARCRRTISVETGCQNVQLCGTVLKLAFNPVLVGVMVLLPIVYMVFQATEAMLLVLLYRILQRYCRKQDLDDISKKSINFDDDDDDEKKDSSDLPKTIIEITEDKLLLKTTEKSDDSQNVEEAKETWRLNPDSLPPPDYLDSFKSGKKENGGKN